MNVTFAICLVVFFSVIAEYLTWIVRKNRTSVFIDISIIRILTTCLSICIIYYIDKQHNDYEFLNESNNFKYELLQYQDSLINYQRIMIDTLANHLWEEHNCDIPQFDGELKINIDYEEQYLDSLYNTQL